MPRSILLQRETFAFRLAGPWHPEIGIEEYPKLTKRERKSLYNEILSQNGPKVLSNQFHPERYKAIGQHHYVARSQDGTIHGVLSAYRLGYDKMEPQRASPYRNVNIRDIYTGDDAPKGTGTALMQAAASRAKRDGANLSVSNVVPAARPFYHAMGGTSTPGFSSFDWEPEDRDALAAGQPNRKPVTPMENGEWDPISKSYPNPIMPPGVNDSTGFGDLYVDPSSRQRGGKQ